MAYSKQTWVRGEKVASVKLNHMEDGIAAISANGAIDTANLATAAVTNDKLDQEAVDSNNIRTGAIITPLIYDGTVTLPKLGADVIAELDNKANIDGSYESMTVGNAEQLMSSVGITDQTPYNFRTTGGSADVGDRLNLKAVVGGTVTWNQLIKNGNFESTNNWRVYTPANGRLSVSENVLTITYLVASTSPGYSFGLTYTGGLQLQTGHKYIIKADANPDFDTQLSFEIGTSIDRNFSVSTNSWTELSIVAMRPSWSNANTFIIKPQHASIAVGSTLKVRNVQLIDLTLLLGSTIADYIYSLEQSSAGSGVAYFKKLFPKPYYAYNSGALLSVRTSAHKTVGFNAYNPTTGTAKIIGGNQYQITGAYTALSLDGTTITPDSNGKFTPSANGTLTVTGGNSTTTCVHLVWEGERDGEYEPYQEWNYPLDSSLTLRGILKLDASNNLYADGDRYLPDGTVERRYGTVDLGTLTWGFTSNRAYITDFATTYNAKLPANANTLCNMLTENPYTQVAGSGTLTSGKYALLTNGALYFYYDGSNKPTGYLVYELATTTTETADQYQQTQIVDDFGTEEFVDAAVEANERDVAVPVGNVTFYPQNLRKKIEGLPFDFSTLIARTEKAFKATKAYAVNEFLIINNQLYKTRTSIANGATITVGTNVIATTIGAELSAILNS